MVCRKNIFFVLRFFFYYFLSTLFYNDANAQEIISGLKEYKKFYYPGGSLSSEGLVVNGKPEGYWKSYFENGKIKSEGNRKNFMLDSLYLHF